MLKVLCCVVAILGCALGKSCDATIMLNAGVYYSGREIFTINYPRSVPSDPDLVWRTVIWGPEVKRLKPTKHFLPEMGEEDDSGWLVLKGGKDGLPDGTLEVRAGAAGLIWIEELRVKRRGPDRFGQSEWVFDAKSLLKVKKKRFVARHLIYTMQASEGRGFSDEDSSFELDRTSEAPGENREFNVVVRDGHVPLFKGSFVSDVIDPDQLWEVFKEAFVQKKMPLQETIDGAKVLSADIVEGTSTDELTFDETSGRALNLHVEGLGIASIADLALAKKKAPSDDSLWSVKSVKWPGKKENGVDKKWLIRRDIVPDLVRHGKEKVFQFFPSSDGQTVNFRIADKGHGRVFRSVVFAFDQDKGVLENRFEFAGDFRNGPSVFWTGCVTNCGNYVVDIRPYVGGNKKENRVIVFDLKRHEKHGFVIDDFLTDKESKRLWSKHRWCWSLAVDDAAFKVYLGLSRDAEKINVGVLDLKSMTIDRIDDYGLPTLREIVDDAKNHLTGASWVCNDQALQEAESFPPKIALETKDSSGGTVTTSFAYDSIDGGYVREDSK